MSLDPHPSEAQLRAKLARLAERTASPAPDPAKHRGVALGPNSPLAKPARRKRSVMNDEEHLEQAKFIAWAKEAEGDHPELWLLHAIPNYSGDLPGYVTQRLLEEGKKKGVLDTHLPVPRGAHASLWIEFKAIGGNPSAEQREWIARLRAAGNRVEVVFTADAAQAITIHYLSLRRP